MTFLCLLRSAEKLWELQHEIEVKSEGAGEGAIAQGIYQQFSHHSSHWGRGVACFSSLPGDCGLGPSVMFICLVSVLRVWVRLDSRPGPLLSSSRTVYVHVSEWLCVAESILSVVETMSSRGSSFHLSVAQLRCNSKKARATSVSTGQSGGALTLSEHLPQCTCVSADISPVRDCPVEGNELGCGADPHAGSCSGFERTGQSHR